MTIRHLTIFIKVYEEKNMSAAAAKLFMTQPSVSQAIRELEEHYHVILFERLSKKLFVTEAGKTLYTYANHILGLFQDLENDLQEQSRENRISVGVNYTVGITMIHDFIHTFKADYPDANVHVSVNRASSIKELLRSNQVDFALLEASHPESDFVSIPFAQDQIVVVANPADPLCHKTNITPADLSKVPLLTREKGVGARDLFESAMQKAGYQISPLWESISITAILKAVEAMEGVAILPYEAVKTQLQAHELVELPVNGINLERKLAIMYHKNKQITPLMNAFMKVILSSQMQESES